jgi:hypothetical protein
MVYVRFCFLCHKGGQAARISVVQKEIMWNFSCYVSKYLNLKKLHKMKGLKRGKYRLNRPVFCTSRNPVFICLVLSYEVDLTLKP